MRIPVPALLVLLALGACSKNNTSSTSSSGVSATAGSSRYQSTTSVGAYSAGLGELTIFSYAGSGSDSTALQIDIPWPAAVNRVLPADSLLTLFYTTKGTEYDAYSTAGQLQLTVTSLDSTGHKLSGTFSAIAHSTANINDSVVITNGKFSSAYNVSP